MIPSDAPRLLIARLIKYTLIDPKNVAQSFFCPADYVVFFCFHVLSTIDRIQAQKLTR